MRQPLTTDSVSRRIGASPEVIYAIVSDVTRTPEYSTEIKKCEWIDGATGPVVGARFRARNSAGRGPDWHNKPVVTQVEPNRLFVVERTERFCGTVQWGFRLEPDGEATRVTQWYRVTDDLTLFGWFIIGGLYGLKDRRGDLRREMEHTLERLAVLATRPATHHVR